MTQCIRVHEMPPCIERQQLQALRKRYQHDTLCIERCRRVHVCVYCAVKRGSQCSKMRYDCVTGSLVCKDCDITSILEVDILGRIAVIGERVILLSSCCGTLIHYTGSGQEFSTTCGPQCARKNQFGKTRIAEEPPRMHLTCAVCHQRNVSQTFDVLCVETRSMRKCGLCPRHHIHPDILQTVGDEHDLHRALALNARPSALTGR